MKNSDLNPGTLLDNTELSDTFKCGTQGGMRRSKATNTLAIISDHFKLYDDRWDGKILHYTGMGRIGDQSLDFMQNKTLNESKTNGVEVHLLEVFIPKVYTYMGKVNLIDRPYQDKQLDDENNMRNVWVFPVELETDIEYHPKKESFEPSQMQKEREVKKLSIDDLRKIVENKSPESSKRIVETTEYERDPHVVEYALRKANGICQLCNNQAPFIRKDGTPFLEVHHILFLSEGGPDTIENTVALCPNCHRKMHHHNTEQERDLLKLMALKVPFV